MTVQLLGGGAVQNRGDSVVRGIAEALDHPVAGLVQYAPDPLIERLFGSLPPLSTPLAEAIGLCHDGSLSRLVQCAIAQG